VSYEILVVIVEPLCSIWWSISKCNFATTLHALLQHIVLWMDRFYLTVWLWHWI